MRNQRFNPASDEFSYGEEVYNSKRKQSGVVMRTEGTLVRVKYYDKQTGDLARYSEPISMQDLINVSSK